MTQPQTFQVVTQEDVVEVFGVADSEISDAGALNLKGTDDRGAFSATFAPGYWLRATARLQEAQP